MYYTNSSYQIGRYLANKCSIASRIDCFSEESTTIFGSKLKEQVKVNLDTMWPIFVSLLRVAIKMLFLGGGSLEVL